MSHYPFSVHVRVRLHAVRKTQKQLAAELGYSPSYLCAYLSGKLPYPPDLRPGIQKVLCRWEAEAQEEACTSRNDL